MVAGLAIATIVAIKMKKDDMAAMRGLEKLRKINSELAYDDNHKLANVS